MNLGYPCKDFARLNFQDQALEYLHKITDNLYGIQIAIN